MIRPSGRRPRRLLGAVALALTLLVAACSSGGTTTLPGHPGSWRLAFGDDFPGSSLDTSLWQPDRGAGERGGIPFNPALEDAWFDPGNVAVADGRLTFTVRQRSRTLDGRGYGTSSGMVQGAPGVVVHQGDYVEARIRFPGCAGCWPAFWLQPQDRWPPEIDAAEYLDTGEDSRPTINYIDPEENRTGSTAYGEPGTDYRNAFHTYGLLWTGSRAVPYLDGKAYPGSAARGPITDVPMMIMLNLSVRRGSDVPAGTQMQVDWVHVWSPAGSGS